MSRKAVAFTVCFLAVSAALVAAVTYGSGEPSPAPAPAAPSAVAGPALHVDDEDDEADMDGDEDIPVPIAEIPDVVLKAAQAALPGFVVMEAERETSRGEWIYSLEGTVDGAEVEIEVAADGSSAQIEDEDD